MNRTTVFLMGTALGIVIVAVYSKVKYDRFFDKQRKLNDARDNAGALNTHIDSRRLMNGRSPYRTI